MKNLLTLCAFAVVMMLGMTNVSAQSLSQDQERPEVIAKTKVAELSSTLDLSGDQQRTLFRYYASHISNMQKYVDGKDVANAAVAADKKKYDAVFMEGVKKTLTADQYKKWSSLQKQ